MFHEPCKRADDLDAYRRPGLVRHGFDLDPLDEVPDGLRHGLAGRLAGGGVGRQGRVDVLDLAGVGFGGAGVQLNRQLVGGAVDFLQLSLGLGFLSFELGQPLGDRSAPQLPLGDRVDQSADLTLDLRQPLLQGLASVGPGLDLGLPGLMVGADVDRHRFRCEELAREAAQHPALDLRAADVAVVAARGAALSPIGGAHQPAGAEGSVAGPAAATLEQA
ncbi:MAG: hypothetical protein O9269_11035 [Brevundimonas sp.]|nr:hypothetical protein [Brevundimonas sp.]MCZ8195038.1 hypothetical protein [Brevundimonas sp.]